jgi:polyhydroxyalkanoate synthase
MTEQTPAAFDPTEYAKLSAEITAKCQNIIQEFMANQERATQLGIGNLTSVQHSFQAFWSQLLADPQKLTEAQMAFWRDYLALLKNSVLHWTGQSTEPVVQAHKKDKRFQYQEWDNNPVFRFIRDAYLLTAQHIQSTVENVQNLDPKTARKVNFYTRQFLDALSPSNFVATNPEVLQTTIDTRGENLVKGLQNMLDDLNRGNGQLAIKMTDLKAFKIGENLAITPGKVIFQNDLMQLIQYQPTTKTVHKTPLLIIPPWINKYYILDLQQHNSLVKYIIDKGYTVFMISWVNPDKRHGDKDFNHYMLEGALAALDAVTLSTGEKEINALGFCIGGTLLACTLAYMAVKKDTRIKSATFLATLLDFRDPGEIQVFIDEDQISALENRMAKHGYLDGGSMSTTFNLLRSNELIWAYFVNNYLHGKEPFPFDLLYWNSDSTNMPASMHSMYLRQMYLQNRLKEAGGISLYNVPINLKNITIPAYFLATQLDHIAPWKSVYEGRHLYGGPVKFVVGGSGHIAGIVNPPDNKKYDYRTNQKHPLDADKWFESSTEHQGSWWPNWLHWLKPHSGEMVKGRLPGGGKLPIIEDAPGSYVKVRLSEIT